VLWNAKERDMRSQCMMRRAALHGWEIQSACTPMAKLISAYLQISQQLAIHISVVKGLGSQTEEQLWK